ncbi:LysR family transcriptional regulator [Oceanobacillus sp. CAU 1775]
MNMKQLRYFFEIANEGQITLAAKKLHISQPPLSQSLKALEDSLGVILFERNGRKMELTEAGAVLYEKAQEIFYKIDETIVEVQETGQGLRGTLSIGCNKSCYAQLPDKISHFQAEYPQTKFRILEGDSYYLTKQLTEREIELAIIRLPIDMTGFSYHPLPSEDYVVVCPTKWMKDEAKDIISIAELADIPLLLLHRLKGIGQYEIILDKFRAKQLIPRIVCESPNVDILLGLVEAGLGATIIPKSTLLKPYNNDVKILHLEDSPIVSESAIIWLKDRYISRSAKRFIGLFQ